MGACMGERLRKPEILNSLVQQSYSFELLSQIDLSHILGHLISSGRLTELGREFYIDIKELQEFPLLRDSPRVVFARSLAEARAATNQLLIEASGFVGYITGGLEGGFLQIMLNGLVAGGEIDTFIIGLEEEKYVASKGRGPLFSTQEKASLWMQLAPDNSVLFIIPPRPESMSPDDYYDWISEYLGVFKNGQVIYFESRDDPFEIIAAHLRRAASPNHILSVSLGEPPLHASELLAK